MVTCMDLRRPEQLPLRRTSPARALFAVAFFILVISLPGQAGASFIINSGWDLFITEPGTQFAGHAFTGVAFNHYDFGGTIGTREVWSTDTIVRRLQSAEIPELPGGSASVQTELAALHLVSVGPIDLGAGFRDYYITLQSERGGQASTGETTITADDEQGGTFESFFDVFFDIRIEGLDGTIIGSGNKRLTARNVAWGRTPPPRAVTIEGVNHRLNGSDADADFWAQGPFSHQNDDGTTHTVTTADVPEPGSGILLSVIVAAACLAVVHGRRR